MRTPKLITASARNRTRHGLLARTVVLAEESTHRFLELLRALIEEFCPTSAAQLILVETMAVARWRQLRIWGLQTLALGRKGAAEVREARAQRTAA